MYVIEIIPFTRGAHVDTLTYYASEAEAPGTIVSIPLRKKEARGMVVESKPVGAAKTAIRAATFSLRKLPKEHRRTVLPQALIETARRLGDRTPASLGAILFALLPPEVQSGDESLHADTAYAEPATAPSVSILTALRDERYRAYRSRIREAFAHGGSVLFVVPSSADIELAEERLAHGIEGRVVAFSPLYGAKKIKRAYEALRDMSHAKLIITTPRHAFIDRHDITDIIIENSRSPFYKSRVRPYLDTRDALRTLAHVTGRTILQGDILPNAEDEHLRRLEVYQTESEHPKRFTFQSTLKAVMLNDKPTADVPFSLFAKPVLAAIEKTIAARKSVFLLAARRGLAPVVACGDCGHIFRCPDSGTPYALVRTTKNGEEERWFLASTSGARVRAADTCPACGSWRLRERGIGIQHIHDELSALLPDIPVTLFDHTTATTHTKAQRAIAEFYDQKGAILLATPMVLPYVRAPIDHTVVVSYDATRSIPTWRADEELFALLLALREHTSGIVYVQTRTEPDTLLQCATRGLIDQFYTDEIALRSSLCYPPFAVFIHLSFECAKEALKDMEQAIEATIAPTPLRFYAPTHAPKGTVLRNGLIRIPAADWPDAALIERLRTLPPSVRIEVNPHRIV